MIDRYIHSSTCPSHGLRFEDSFYKPVDRSGFKGPVPTATRAWFYALTNIRVRETADVASKALGTVIRKGETFEVDAELVVMGRQADT